MVCEVIDYCRFNCVKTQIQRNQFCTHNAERCPATSHKPPNVEEKSQTNKVGECLEQMYPKSA